MKRRTFLDKAYSLKSGAETEAFYREWARSYDEELLAQGYAQPHRCAKALRDRLSDRASPVLDVGCGTGLSGQALSDAGFNVIDGCDFSREMLEKADRRSIYRSLFQADLNRPPLPCEDDAYDAALAVGVFSYGHVSPDALDEILRVLKPGGALIVGVNGHFYDEGSLRAKVDDLVLRKKLVVLAWEHGDHIPGADLDGWVLRAERAG